jgi:hypothetical protein
MDWLATVTIGKGLITVAGQWTRFHYLRANAFSLVNDGERYRRGERISTAGNRWSTASLAGAGLRSSRGAGVGPRNLGCQLRKYPEGARRARPLGSVPEGARRAYPMLETSALSPHLERPPGTHPLGPPPPRLDRTRPRAHQPPPPTASPSSTPLGPNAPNAANHDAEDRQPAPATLRREKTPNIRPAKAPG